MDKLVANLLMVLFPYLKDMAKKSDTPIDDFIVNVLSLILDDLTKEE